MPICAPAAVDETVVLSRCSVRGIRRQAAVPRPRLNRLAGQDPRNLRRTATYRKANYAHHEQDRNHDRLP